MDHQGRPSSTTRVWAGLAVVLLAGSAASCPAQEVIYSSASGRYEQYGFGRNAVVRYQGTETNPYSQGVSVQSEANLQRVGPAPAFGSFYGNLVTSQGPTPGGLFRGLANGGETHGQVRNTLIAQPYSQWTPYGYVVVQPQPYFAQSSAAPGSARAPVPPARVQAPASHWPAPARGPAAVPKPAQAAPKPAAPAAKPAAPRGAKIPPVPPPPVPIPPP